MSTVGSRLRGFIRRPTAEQLAEIGKQEFIHLNPEEAIVYLKAVDGVLSLMDRLDDLLPPRVDLRHRSRDPGHLPTREEDPFNVFTRICHVEGASEGPLAGVRVGVKDNLAVAGVPTTNASRTAPHVPTGDAVVVERLLDAGARIVGKLNMDDFATAGTGETSFWGPARNPFDPRRSAGGSSSGAGAAVASGDVDLAIAVDQGGSARIPASFCGVVSLKATHGIIPSYGVTHIDHTLDAICPVGRTVHSVAVATDVMSGYDWRDPQWVRASVQRTNCAEEVNKGIEGVRIGVLKESAGESQCEPGVLEGFEKARKALVDAGAEVVQKSVSLWHDAWAIEVTMLCHLAWAMAQSEGQGFGHMGLIDVDRVHAFALTRRTEADEFPPFLKVWLLAGRYLHDYYYSTYFAKAQNLRLALRSEVTAALVDCDLLLTPTTPHVAPVMPDHPVGDLELLARGTTMASNTAPLNLTGHPALAVPSGLDQNGMPVSVQLIGRHFEDALTLRAGAIIEARFGSPVTERLSTKALTS